MQVAAGGTQDGSASRVRRDRLATMGIDALAGVERLGPFGHLGEEPACRAELGDLPVDVVEMVVEEGDDVVAGLFTVVP